MQYIYFEIYKFLLKMTLKVYTFVIPSDVIVIKARGLLLQIHIDRYSVGMMVKCVPSCLFSC